MDAADWSVVFQKYPNMVFTFLYVCLKKMGYNLEYLWIFFHVGDVALYNNCDQKHLPVCPLLRFSIMWQN